jgi:hypothetical protein
VLSNPHLPNTGHVRQIVPGQNFPAQFFIRRFGVLETSTMRLAHRNVIAIDGTIDGIPPYKKPLSAPLLGAPLGDGPGTVVPGPNVVRGVNLPEAWYPANRMNQAVGITPTVFFADSFGPCISTLVDPSMIIQSTVEGTIGIEVNGRSEKVEIFGDHRLAAGTEILLFGPDKHGERAGTLSQLARVALVGNCEALGGRVMLRASFFKPSGGSIGEGHESDFEALRYPAALHFDTQFEIATPTGPLYGVAPTFVRGVLNDLAAVNSELRMEGAETALIDANREVKARLTSVHLVLRESIVGREAIMTETGFAPEVGIVGDQGREGDLRLPQN